MSAVWCAAARTLVDDRKKEPEVNKLGESHTLLSQARIFCRWIRTLALTFFEDSLPEHKKKKKMLAAGQPCLLKTAEAPRVVDWQGDRDPEVRWP